MEVYFPADHVLWTVRRTKAENFKPHNMACAHKLDQSPVCAAWKYKHGAKAPRKVCCEHRGCFFNTHNEILWGNLRIFQTG